MFILINHDFIFKNVQKFENINKQKYTFFADIQAEVIVSCHQHQSHQHRSHTAVITNDFSSDEVDDVKPPPLPPKKKHSECLFLSTKLISTFSN